ncbi:hypothetical protein [Streptomyces sp. NPDC056491]|uniref:hypothetical protein n=1 Tax=Streptomyces sp. NPDC056491 TaxID=3345837 RepID=UPI0036AFB062
MTRAAQQEATRTDPLELVPAPVCRLKRDASFAELQRMESDPAFRAHYLAELDALIVRNTEDATAEIHRAIYPDSEERAA